MVLKLKHLALYQVLENQTANYNFEQLSFDNLFYCIEDRAIDILTQNSMEELIYESSSLKTFIEKAYAEKKLNMLFAIGKFFCTKFDEFKKKDIINIASFYYECVNIFYQIINDKNLQFNPAKSHFEKMLFDNFSQNLEEIILSIFTVNNLELFQKFHGLSFFNATEVAKKNNEKFLNFIDQNIKTDPLFFQNLAKTNDGNLLDLILNILERYYGHDHQKTDLSHQISNYINQTKLKILQIAIENENLAIIKSLASYNLIEKSKYDESVQLYGKQANIGLLNLFFNNPDIDFSQFADEMINLESAKNTDPDKILYYFRVCQLSIYHCKSSTLSSELIIKALTKSTPLCLSFFKGLNLYAQIDDLRNLIFDEQAMDNVKLYAEVFQEIITNPDFIREDNHKVDFIESVIFSNWENNKKLTIIKDILSKFPSMFNTIFNNLPQIAFECHGAKNSQCRMQILELLIDNQIINFPQLNHQFALNNFIPRAIKSQNSAAINLLFDKIEDLDLSKIQPDISINFLYQAVDKNNSEIVNLLINKGASTDSPSLLEYAINIKIKLDSDEQKATNEKIVETIFKNKISKNEISLIDDGQLESSEKIKNLIDSRPDLILKISPSASVLPGFYVEILESPRDGQEI